MNHRKLVHIKTGFFIFIGNMSRETEILQKVAKEFASELENKEKDPSYEPILDRHDCIRRLSTVMDRSYGETATVFDKSVNRYRAQFRRMNDL